MEMITINLSPVRGFIKTELSTTGLVVTINGNDYDLSLLDDGAKVIHPVIGEVTRTGDDYELTVTLIHGRNALESVRFPEPLLIDGEYKHEYEEGEL
jgi:hypothetical protein